MTPLGEPSVDTGGLGIAGYGADGLLVIERLHLPPGGSAVVTTCAYRTLAAYPVELERAVVAILVDLVRHTPDADTFQCEVPWGVVPDGVEPKALFARVIVDGRTVHVSAPPWPRRRP